MQTSLALPARLSAPHRTLTVQMMDHADDKALYASWLEGDTAGFTALYARHNPRIVAYCAKILHDMAEAEDTAHRAWEKLIENRSSRIDSPIGFLIRSAKNLAIDHLRRQKFTAQIEEAGQLGLTNEVTDREWVVLECLDELKEQTREILVLHYYSGYSFDEIAEMMNMKPNAVYTRVSRARAELRQLVEQRLAGFERIGARK